MLYIDLAKAFDSVNVDLLIKKLKFMGLNNQLVDWIESYLDNRKQIVKVGNIKSNAIEVLSGTGQGYPIAASLFLMFIIDLPLHKGNSSILTFADDARLTHHITSINDCKMLQNDLINITEYFKANQLKLNIKKTKMIRFHRSGKIIDYEYNIDGIIIEKVNQIRDLGVILDERLNFKAHIDFIINKAKSRLAWLKRFSREFLDPWTIKKLFFTFVIPILEYGSQIWNTYYIDQTKRIESVQKQFLLYALRRFNWPDNCHIPKYEHRLLLLQMSTLEDRRKIAQSIFILKVRAHVANIC